MEIIEKIKSKSAIIGIIGMGYVGLPLALAFAEKGFLVMGFDVDENKKQKLNEGQSYIKHISSRKIKKAVVSGRFNATTDFSKISEADAVIICVPTPLDEHREPDMSFVVNTAETIQKYLRKGQLVTLESTTYPGTTEEILLPLFENALSVQIKKSAARREVKPQLAGAGFGGDEADYAKEIENLVENKNGNESEKTNEKLVVGKDFFLAYSPEREDPNNPDFKTETIPKVIGGVTPRCLDAAKTLYDQIIVRTVPVSSPSVAEATKLLENIYRSVNIALVNELKMVFNKMNIDLWEVIEAASTKPFGFQPFYPGPGLGGHCIPIDPFYLTWKVREYDANTRFIELAGEINTYQPYYVVETSMEVLNRFGKTLKDSNVLILGASYKKNIDDLRESPSLKLIEILREKGALVDYNDPYIPKLPLMRKYKFNLESVELTAENMAKYDLVVLSTDHEAYDYGFIYRHSKIIIDTRNAFRKLGIKNGKVFKA